MLIPSLTQWLLGSAALLATAAAASMVLTRDTRAPLWMVISGSIAFAFFLTFDPVRYEIIASILLIATGVVLMLPHFDASSALEDIGVEESTATRRR